jgi:hypothetical protein
MGTFAAAIWVCLYLLAISQQQPSPPEKPCQCQEQKK